MQFNSWFSANSSIKRKLWLITVFILAVVSVFTWISISSLSAYQQANTEYREEVSSRINLLQQLRYQLGYDGAIHQFKNYVLRGKNKDRDASLERFKQAKLVIAEYKTLNLTISEKHALEAVDRVITEYQSKLFQLPVEYHQSLTIDQIDDQARVDDEPAIHALNNLEHTAKDREAEQLTKVNALFSEMRWKVVIATIVIFLVSIVCMTWLYRTLTRRLKQFAQYSEKLQKSVYHHEPAQNETLSWEGDELNEIAGNLEKIIELLRCEKDRAEQSSRSKTEFLAVVSHEIRTPMNGVLGIAQLLQKTDLSDSQRSHLQNLHESGEHMMTLLNEILDFSKIEQGKFELDNHPFAFTHLMGSVSSIYQSLAEEKGVDLYIDNKVAPDRWVNSDKARVRQVMFNLLNNAIKFTEKGFIELKVEEQIEGEKTVLTVSIKDTGIGMSEETLKRLFNPFEQADSSTTRKYGGTGLGLSIVFRLVKQMGGDIKVASELEMGSCFTVTMPLALAEPQLAVVQDTRPLNYNGLTALIVEDNRLNAMVLQSMLKQCGFVTECIENGELAYELTKTKTFNLILMDNHMPVKDGIEATYLIRQDSLNKNTLILGCTADLFKETRDKMKQAGVDNLIAKPVVERELHETLSSYAEKLFPNGIIYKQTESANTHADTDTVDINLIMRKNAVAYDVMPVFINNVIEEALSAVTDLNTAQQNQDLENITASAKVLSSLFEKVALSGMVVLADLVAKQKKMDDQQINQLFELTHQWLDELCLIAEECG
ncbi:putative TWO-COMPONENT SENSOR PROTEIN HISTIDINE PROTEIN KINASE [Vibrio nigripulchritudo SOn1]|uniref:histidine kinase n=1 Tax=Vibrio nigripulchritudo SOn1 TaxID=1238450 RepID=A0AAV2VIG4_9VIBR|nr:ATP-binding protein [Vibrio nigripulchritudo]CCO44428.1 putative TWO-COMPONENT SENSOR PROTEIN HISTIDINE PROTEIN KINASE [Vibrio nigripulchritudo SOn1]